MAIIAEAQVELNWPQQQQVPLDGYYKVFRDNRDGVVDYDSPVNALPIPAWPEGVGKRAFGLGLFGAGMFGFGAVGYPFGHGRFGMGRFGFGAEMHAYLTPPLADGTWRFAVVGFDPAGNPAAPAAAIEHACGVAGSPRPPSDLEATAYAAGVLTLDWTLSEDDEG